MSYHMKLIATLFVLCSLQSAHAMEVDGRKGIDITPVRQKNTPILCDAMSRFPLSFKTYRQIRNQANPVRK